MYLTPTGGDRIVGSEIKTKANWNCLLIGRVDVELILGYRCSTRTKSSKRGNETEEIFHTRSNYLLPLLTFPREGADTSDPSQEMCKDTGGGLGRMCASEENINKIHVNSGLFQINLDRKGFVGDRYFYPFTNGLNEEAVSWACH